MKMTKIEALAKYLEVETEDLKEVYENTFENGNKEYMVLTDAEADQKAAEYIKDTLWAFRKSFLDGYGDVIGNLDDKAWKAVVDRCESSNPAILAMVGKDNMEALIEDAIACDGRGHFLSSYDGEENEEGGYYIYRTN
jgi:hypothetical protein